jgi:16S rRNA (uracil1498-N3)-methyltransferase
MHLFFEPDIAIDAQDFVLSEEESGHACRVLRLRTADLLSILDGKGNQFTCRITDPHPKKCKVDILTVYSEKESASSIHLAIAPTKNMERMEWLAEKVTEMGITHLTLLQCRNNERKQVKLDRLQRILISAMKQSQRLHLPKLDDLYNFNDFVQSFPNGLIAHCSEGSKEPIQALSKENKGPILIGPEGDFTKEEVDFALQNGYKSITLGKNRLRTETAGLVVCAAAVLNSPFETK